MALWAIDYKISEGYCSPSTAYIKDYTTSPSRGFSIKSCPERGTGSTERCGWILLLSKGIGHVIQVVLCILNWIIIAYLFVL